MRYLRSNMVLRFVWLILAVHIFNLSVDTPDGQPDCIPEDLSYNDIESFVEFILEDCLNIYDAIPEHDEHDEQDGNSIEMKKFCAYFQPGPARRLAIGPDQGRKMQMPLSFFYPERYIETFNPPPEA